MLIRIRSRAPIVALLLLVCLFTACSDADKQLAIAAKTNIEVQKFAIEAEKKGHLTVAETKAIVDATARVGKVGLAAVAVLERVEKDDPESKTAALDALGIVADELGKLDLVTVGIKNENARHNIEALLAVIQTSLNSARVIIAASK